MSGADPVRPPSSGPEPGSAEEAEQVAAYPVVEAEEEDAGPAAVAPVRAPGGTGTD